MNIQLAILQNDKIKIVIIPVKNNIIILKLITVAGIFYKIIFNFLFYLLNLQQNLLIKNSIKKINTANQIISFLIKNTFTLFHYTRYYLKLKGLGFSIKYLTLPQHFLLLNIGFSKLRYIKIPQKINIIRKPRKKKYIFTLISTNLHLLSSFSTLIRTLKIPDPYKIKGFRYIQEAIILKTGKKKK
jgi:ribosomal protein L6P/L9E